jgi:hypothetical protein
MQPSLAVLCLVRNEANRWLPSILNGWASFADVIVALDDGSTDSTPELLHSHPKVELTRRQAAGPMWGQEAPARQQLWQLGIASGCDWLMVLDADMIPARDPRPLLHASADAIAFLLYDLWHLHPALYRDDGYWQAHRFHRTWAVRNIGPGFADQWPDRGLHTGHFPLNLQIQRQVFAPPEFSLLHLAYSDARERSRKAEQYASKAHVLTRQEQLHAASILDGTVACKPLPFPVEYAVEKAAL